MGGIELGQARNQERATEGWKRTQKEEGGAEGRAVFIVSRKQQGLCTRAFPDQATSKQGGGKPEN
jgi:hypothetical protein